MPVNFPGIGVLRETSPWNCVASVAAPPGASPQGKPLIQPEYLFIIAGILFAILLLQFFGRRKRRGRSFAESLPRPSSKRTVSQAPGIPLRERAGISSDMRELLVELQELSRTINAQMDTKFARLESSVRSADRRIADLERLIRRAERVPAVDVTVGEPGPETLPAAQSAPADVSAGDDEKKESIYKLADDGSTPREIAQQLQLNTGEVELILALRDKQNE